MNSFSFMEKAIEAEVARQIEEYEANPDKDPKKVIGQATYRWDPDKKQTVLMRQKEYAEDYRYFPEPDLPPILLEQATIDKIRAELPELPLQRERRYVNQLGLSPHNAFVLTSDKKLADYFEKALATCSNGRNLCNWIIVEFAGRLKESGRSLLETGISPENVASLVNLIEKGTITGKIAKSIADDMLSNPTLGPDIIMAQNPDYTPLSDSGEIEKIVSEVVDAHQQSVVDYKAGKEKAFAFLVGQVMKATRGKANPQLVNDLLKSRMNS